jgi:hypothetical protein
MMWALWLVIFATAAAFGWLIWHNLRKIQERRRAEAERFANFIAGNTGAAAQNAPAPSPAPTPALPGAASSIAPGAELSPQKLLFDAARKAGEAGEPALAIQLYGRLLARYPATEFAGEARATVEALKKKLLKTKL